jgi:hypothetical protein
LELVLYYSKYLPEHGPPATPIRKGRTDAVGIEIDDLE